jgi:uncharacterized protein (DUF58 family)
MAFRGPSAPTTKASFAALVAASLSHVALVSGDPASLVFVGGEKAFPVRRAGGREQFERVVAALETAAPGGDATVDRAMLSRALHTLARSARRGAIVVLVSDLIDLPEGAVEQVVALAPAGRVLVVVQVLDPAELDLPYEGTVRLRALEGGAVVETDAGAARPRYRAALAALSGAWREAVVARGGTFVRASTAGDPVHAVRAVVEGIRQRTGAR